MQPSAFIAIDRIPRLPNGKIDFEALPEQPLQESDNGFIEPRNAVEQLLVAIWSEVLNLDRVSITDHFLQVGGDSILSIQVIARARKADLFITPNDMLEHPTIAELAQLVEENSSVNQKAHELVEGEIPLTPIQHWFFETIKPVPQHWNHALQLSLSGQLKPEMVHRAMLVLCKHHDSLRLQFNHDGNGWQQNIQGGGHHLPWQVTDLSQMSEEQLDRTITQAINKDQAGIDLSSSVIHASFYQTPEKLDNRLSIIIHHLAIDTVSWMILLDDLDQLLLNQLNHQPMKLSKKTLSYLDWTNHLLDDSESDACQSQLPRWQAIVDNDTGRLPTDYSGSRQDNTEAANRSHTLTLDKQSTQALITEAGNAYQTNINDILLTALLLSLNGLTGRSSWIIDLESSGRNATDVDLSRSVGWFTSYYPVALKLDQQETGSLIKSVKEQLRRVPGQNQSYAILRYLTGNKELAPLVPTDILFNYWGQFKLPEFAAFKIEGDLAMYIQHGINSNPKNYRSHLLEINAVINNNVLSTIWKYSDRHFKADTIETVATLFHQALKKLIEHCQLPGTGGYTPSDFAESGLNQDQLDNFLDRLGSQD